VQGAECFPVFMQSGLDKAILKRMWDLVAGNSGAGCAAIEVALLGCVEENDRCKPISH